MNSISIHPDELRGSRLTAAVRYAQRALCSLTWQEAAYFLFTGLLVAALNSVMGIEMLRKSGESAFLVHGVLLPLLIGPFVMAGWVLADRAEPAAWPRTARLTVGLLLSVTAAVVLVPLLLGAIGLKLPTELRSDGKSYEIPAWSKHVALWLDVAIYCGLTFAVLEFRRRRERSQQVLQAALTEQAQLSRQLLESRLAAMQAQVEPQFLFDSLVDVQGTYDRNTLAGAEVMDRLINYLRVALPRLREQGSTVQAEVELLAAYLGVVAARHAGRPSVQFVVAPDAAGARFYPMLLLPLVQRAMRLAAAGRQVPDYVELVVKRHGDELGVLLRIEAGGLCTDDPELIRVRERLAGLYADRAQLACTEPRPGCTEFVLRVPQPQALAS